jgi:hypothetical protein
MFPSELGGEEPGELGMQFGAAGGFQPQLHQGEPAAAVGADTRQQLLEEGGDGLDGRLHLQGVGHLSLLGGEALLNALHDLGQQFGTVGEVVDRVPLGTPAWAPTARSVRPREPSLAKASSAPSRRAACRSGSDAW